MALFCQYVISLRNCCRGCNTKWHCLKRRVQTVAYWIRHVEGLKERHLLGQDKTSKFRSNLLCQTTTRHLTAKLSKTTKNEVKSYTTKKKKEEKKKKKLNVFGSCFGTLAVILVSDFCLLLNWSGDGSSVRFIEMRGHKFLFPYFLTYKQAFLSILFLYIL